MESEGCPKDLERIVRMTEEAGRFCESWPQWLSKVSYHRTATGWEFEFTAFGKRFRAMESYPFWDDLFGVPDDPSEEARQVSMVADRTRRSLVDIAERSMRQIGVFVPGRVTTWNVRRV